MNDANIVLTGFMGTGKSSIGRELAAALGWGFVDTDDLIVQRDGRAIVDIFRESGEAAFRTWERTVAAELAESSQLVIATGGRMMLDDTNAANLSRNGRVLCLTATPADILARLADDVRRPLLDVPDPQQRIQELLAERAAGYGRYPQITTSNRTIADVVAAILAQFNLTPLQRMVVSHPQGQYPVLVGSNLLPRLRQLANLSGPYVVVTDSNVGPRYGDIFDDALAVVTVPAGEQFKTLQTMHNIYDGLLAAGLDRTGTVVAVGGGVVGDMAGFAAASYMRGVDFIQCPTSLLAMVDASVGGKTGVDLPQGKNLVGAFKQPTAVLADVATLQTLPAVELTSGMAEVIKHGLINDPKLFEELEAGVWELRSDDPSSIINLQSLIFRAIQVKRDVVQADPFEQGQRALLNLGHTFGHAIEQVSGYAIRHGEGVAMGLVCAAHLSAQLGYADAALQARIDAVVAQANLPVRIPGLSATAVYQAMGSDKKKAAAGLRFILIRDVGDCFVQGGVPKTAVLATLTALGAVP